MPSCPKASVLNKEGFYRHRGGRKRATLDEAGEAVIKREGEEKPHHRPERGSDVGVWQLNLSCSCTAGNHAQSLPFGLAVPQAKAEL